MLPVISVCREMGLFLRFLGLRYRLWLTIAVATLVPLAHTHLADAAPRPEIGTRALGLGGAFISRADDPTGALWNPAGLANLETGSLVYDLSQGAFSLAYPFDRVGTFGVSLLDLNEADRFFIESTNNPIGTFELGSNQILLSYARSFGKLQVGGNFGYSRVGYVGSQWIPSYDLGFITKVAPQVTLGATLRDITGVSIPDADGNLLQEFDQHFAFGVTWELNRYLQLSSTLDTTLWALRTGFEVGTNEYLFRLGPIFELTDSAAPLHWSSGFSLTIAPAQIFYAYSNQPTRNHRHFVSVGWRFGDAAQVNPSPPMDTDVPPVVQSQTPTDVTQVATNGEPADTGQHTAPPPRIETPRPVKPSPQQSSTDNRTTSTAPTRKTESQRRVEPSPQQPTRNNRKGQPALTRKTETSRLVKPNPQQSSTDNRSTSPSPTREIATRHGVELELLLALVKVESNFHPTIVSPSGAGGLTQLMPSTAGGLGLKVPKYSNPRKPNKNPSVDERFHPRKNLEAGTAYLGKMLKMYDGNHVLAMAAYNAGPRNVKKNVPLRRTTEQHVGKVTSHYWKYKGSSALTKAHLQRLDEILSGSNY